MRYRHCPDSVCEISEVDFWASMGSRPVGNGGSHLAQAIEAGKADRKARAYRSLVAYHRQSLAEHWEQRQRKMAAAAVDPKGVADLLHNRIDGWHATVVNFGKKVDWDTTAFGPSGLCGFHYLGWMVPAIHHLVQTGDARTRKWLIDTIVGYYAARNRLMPAHTLGHHPTYYELGAGSKSRILTDAYLVLIHTGALPVTVAEALNKLFLGFARSLALLQRGYRSGNWQINGCASLFLLASLFPEYGKSSAWKRLAIRYLMEHIRRDFFADGGHKERCWGYGAGAAAHLTEAYLIAQRHGGLGKDDAAFRRGIQKAYRWFVKTLGPGMLQPAYGDGQLGPGASILDSAVLVFPKGTDRSIGVDRGKSYLMRSSGYAIMRNGDEASSAYVNASLGPFRGWHSHQDTLSMNVWAQGKPLIEEMGRFGGYDNPLTVLFREAPAHNLVTIDGMHWDDRDNRNRTARDVHWFTCPEFDYLGGYHTAYRPSPLDAQQVSAIVRRTIVFVKDPGYVVVMDTVRDDNEKQPAFSLTCHWHSPYPFKVLRAGVACAQERASAPGCLVVFARTEHLRRMETGVDYSREDDEGTGPWPNRYHLRVRRWMPVGHIGCIGFTTLLYPFTGKVPTRVSIKPLSWRASRPFEADAYEVTTPRGKDVLVLNPQHIEGLTWRGRTVSRAIIILGAGRGRIEC